MSQVQAGPLSFSANMRVRKASDFRYIKERAQVQHSTTMLLLSATQEQGRARLGLVVTKKTGCAAVRNRWKRKIREYFRLHPENFHNDQDYVFIVKSKTKGMPGTRLEQEIEYLLRKQDQGRML
ncbi:MAG: ribonuclease P protein component [Bdellovibrionales bacterium]|nr:ribonuclease P protein component [Bdellovibrionales bacterium]